MQLRLDFSGKKTERITFAATEELKHDLEEVSKRLNCPDISDLVREYVIECVSRDKGKLMLMEARGQRIFINMA